MQSGSKTLYEGTIALADGSKTLHDGSKEMKSGLNILNDGSSELTNANNQLTDGANSLSKGVSDLANGVSKFNKDGIQTISNYINGDLKDISVKLEKLQELADDYNNFSMLHDESEGNVKFIMITDSIRKE